MDKPSNTIVILRRNIADLETENNYLRATSENKTKMLYALIAVSLAYHHAPIPSDTDIVIGPYFAANIEPEWNAVLAELNEERVIDYQKISGMARRIYMSRYDQAHGRKPLKQIIDGICENAYLNETDRSYLECLEDAYD